MGRFLYHIITLKLVVVSVGEGEPLSVRIPSPFVVLTYFVIISMNWMLLVYGQNVFLGLVKDFIRPGDAAVPCCLLWHYDSSIVIVSKDRSPLKLSVPTYTKYMYLSPLSVLMLFKLTVICCQLEELPLKFTELGVLAPLLLVQVVLFDSLLSYWQRSVVLDEPSVVLDSVLTYT